MTTEEKRRLQRQIINRRYRIKHRDKCRAYAKAYQLAHKKPLPPLPSTKVCAECQIEKPLEAFGRNGRVTGQRPSRGGFGVDKYCKACRSHRRKPTLLQERKEQAELEAAGLKRCGSCSLIKPRSDFAVRRASKDGLSYTCRLCANARCIAWRTQHPHAFANWYQQNKDQRAEYWLKWYEANKEARAQQYAQWAKQNAGLINALIAKRTAVKRQAMPVWADRAAIKAIYQEAARLSRETGIRHDVDHIYPLQSEAVCGLHCEANLQILTKVENIRKSNKMPTPPHDRSR